jgi:hypothetical protein
MNLELFHYVINLFSYANHLLNRFFSKFQHDFFLFEPSPNVPKIIVSLNIFHKKCYMC